METGGGCWGDSPERTTERKLLDHQFFLFPHQLDLPEYIMKALVYLPLLAAALLLGWQLSEPAQEPEIEAADSQLAPNPTWGRPARRARERCFRTGFGLLSSRHVTDRSLLRNTIGN